MYTGTVDRDGTMQGAKGKAELLPHHPDADHERCCNCGFILPAGHMDVVIWDCWYAACSEGCAIQLVARGKCSTNSNHPWDRDWTDEQQEEAYPELREVRDYISAGEG